MGTVPFDVAAFAGQNGFEANYPLDPRETVVLINIGAAISNINIVRSGVALFTRDVTIGGNAFTEEIQKQLGIAADEAEAYKVGGSQVEDGVVPQEVLRVMDGVSEIMAGEFQRSLDFFLATTADANVTRIVLAGVARRSVRCTARSNAGRGSRSRSSMRGGASRSIRRSIARICLHTHPRR
jgi:type IV pilus assembly protein PilM